MPCPDCGKDNPAEAAECVFCGYPLGAPAHGERPGGSAAAARPRLSRLAVASAALLIPPTAFDGIDIQNLHGGAPSVGDCTTGDDCMQTVMVHNECRDANTVNYIAGGLAASLCGIPWFVWYEYLAWAFHGGIDYHARAVAWAWVGYAGWPDEAEDPTDSVPESRCAKCDSVSTENSFTVTWTGLGTMLGT